MTNMGGQPQPDADRRYAYSPLLHVLTHILVLVSLLLPSSVPTYFRRLLFFPIAFLVYYIGFLSKTGEIGSDEGVGSAIMTQGIIALDFVFLHDPRKELKRRSFRAAKSDEDVEDKDPGKTLKQRISWALSLLANQRGYGWSFEPAPGILPPRPPSDITRAQFITSQVWILIICAGVEIFSYIINTANPAMQTGIRGPEISLGWRFLALVGFLGATFSRLHVLYRMVALVAVSLCISQPQDWPDMFGKFQDAWSVGIFWGRVWHQAIRRPLCAVTDSLLPPKLKSSLPGYAFIRLFIVFFMSGLLHSAAEYMMLNYFTFEPLFFWIVQPFAIIFEKFLIFPLFRDAKNPTTLEKLIGYIFVISWFTWACPWVINPKIDGGLFGPGAETGNLGYYFVRAVK